NNTVYFNRDGGYAYWNVATNAGTSGYSDIIPPMQGFFVMVTASASLTMPVGSKTTSAAGVSRSKGASTIESSSIKKIKLVLNNGSVLPDETIVCLIDDATTGFDGDYDGYKLFGKSTSIPYIYSELNDIKYAINAVQGSESELVIIPVTVVLKTQGTYKIDITEFENLEDVPVVLKHGTVETILSQNASYTFTSEAGTFTDFQLIFGNTVTGVESISKEKLKTWYSNNFLYINCPGEIFSGNGSLVIYDLQGKPVYNNTRLYLTPEQTIQLPLTLPKGVYITRVIVNSKPFVSKIVVF
ncbi:MAG: T9SS type A sorting domain-containing protein, partial [Bacteroidia bacterium]|nr:T9SS type A sorting domain-containing protein [Bacteroidia bacterium]